MKLLSNSQLHVSRCFRTSHPIFTDQMEVRDFAALTDRRCLGALLNIAHPTKDRDLPAPASAIAGASDERDALTFGTGQIDLGSVSMRSFVFHGE